MKRALLRGLVWLRKDLRLPLVRFRKDVVRPLWLSSLVACGTSAPLGCTAPQGGAQQADQPIADPHGSAAAATEATASAAAPSAKASAAAAASSAVTPALPELPAGIEQLAPRACRLQSATFRSGSAAAVLRLTEGGPAFARFDGGGASLSIPVGKAASTLLETSAEGVVVRGFLDASAVVLRPARAFVMGGFLVPNGSATLSFTSAKEDGLTVALKPAQGIFLKSKLVEEERPCGDVGFDVTTYDTKAPVFGARRASAMLIRRGPVPLMLKPTDKTSVATLSVPEDHEMVQRYFVEGDRSLIAWEAESMLVFGWVSSQALREVHGGHGSLGPLRGFGTMGASRGKPVALVQCDEDVPVIAEVKDVTRTVGQVLKGTPITVLEWGTPRARIELFTKALVPDAGARFFVRTPEIERCRKLPLPAATP